MTSSNNSLLRLPQHETLHQHGSPQKQPGSVASVMHSKESAHDRYASTSPDSVR
ncbi:hypothetical protein BAUCODRAFT_37028 [Baudoinia panamericana UAMH 10762]|uniref:Uncharacterized protein n=1 Tax=Baudoinia panamericana (strain UAMH 10762) TaxID=717646 RepID=M2MPE9_BAUPA|nr:uncharacterized protein BAUCODRAFT_37028 [Baudoinia panamericana UAMH 10762]EMC93343.1 hypothetical protein BAUCODRAFT_37028 [Baudoinia panamericana UAMH 10762]